MGLFSTLTGGLLDDKTGAGLVGSLLGAGASKDTTTSMNRDPWAPAQPYILDNLKTGQQLQNFYKQNPWSPQQKTAYQNLFNGTDAFNQQTMPGLMALANKGVTTSYPSQGLNRLNSTPVQSGAGPFAAPQTQAIGQIDWNAINPFSSQNQPAAPAPVAANTGGGLLQGGAAPGQIQGSGGVQFGNNLTGQTSGSLLGDSIGIGNYTDKINADARDNAKTASIAGPVASLITYLISKGLSKSEALAQVNSMGDPIAALDALQSWTTIDPTHDYMNATPYSGYGSGNGGMSQTRSQGYNSGYSGDSSHGSQGY